MRSFGGEHQRNTIGLHCHLTGKGTHPPKRRGCGAFSQISWSRTGPCLGVHPLPGSLAPQVTPQENAQRDFAVGRRQAAIKISGRAVQNSLRQITWAAGIMPQGLNPAANGGQQSQPLAVLPNASSPSDIRLSYSTTQQQTVSAEYHRRRNHEATHDNDVLCNIWLTSFFFFFFNFLW